MNYTQRLPLHFAVLLSGLMSFVLIGKIEVSQPETQQIQTHRTADF